MYCPNCGKEIPNSSRKCPYCEEAIGRSIHNSKKKKVIIPAIIICIALIGVAWYFLYFTKTPTYSLNLIKESIEKHDVNLFKKHVDLDTLLSHGFDDLVSASLDNTPNDMGKSIAEGFMKMLKPSIVESIKNSIFESVETGNWENNKKAQADDAQINPNEMVEGTGLKKAQFKGFGDTKINGNTAIVEIKITDPDIQGEFPLDVKMVRLDDKTWQVSEISNLKDYIAKTMKK